MHFIQTMMINFWDVVAFFKIDKPTTCIYQNRFKFQMKNNFNKNYKPLRKEKQILSMKILFRLKVKNSLISDII